MDLIIATEQTRSCEALMCLCFFGCGLGISTEQTRSGEPVQCLWLLRGVSRLQRGLRERRDPWRSSGVII
jgi:hypothetical protein